MLVFKKQVDNLKTNHRGVYVLTDNSFRPLSRMSASAGGQAVARAQPVCYITSFAILTSLVYSFALRSTLRFTLQALILNSNSNFELLSKL
jgi:hypothetical protein